MVDFVYFLADGDLLTDANGVPAAAARLEHGLNPGPEAYLSLIHI